MTQYQLSDDQKERLCSIVEGLKEGYIDREWTIAYGGEGILGIFGLQDKENTGKLWRDVWDGVTFADFADFVKYGFFGISGYDRYGRPTGYTLHKQRIIEACENNFELPSSQTSVEQQFQTLESKQTSVTKPTIFISHMHADKAIANTLESFVKDSLMEDVFVFSIYP